MKGKLRQLAGCIAFFAAGGYLEKEINHHDLTSVLFMIVAIIAGLFLMFSKPKP